MARDTTAGCAFCFLLVWIVINIGDAFWLYFYVQSQVNPTPRTAVNRTSSAFEGYQAMMFIFGFPWGVINMIACGGVLLLVIKGDSDRGSSYSRGTCNILLRLFFGVFIIFPITVFMTIMPFFGGWIVTPIVQNYTWKHRCDGFPMYAILDGTSYNSPRYVKDVIYFYETSTDRYLYTYEISNPDDNDQWYFRLRDWQVAQDVIPLDEYPTLQSVGYDFVNLAVNGNCTLPASPTNFLGNTTTSSCVSGTFDPGNHFFFNVTSTVPLNNTANATTIKPVTTLLNIEDSAWTYSDQPPALVLHQTDPKTNALGAVVLRTAVGKYNDCTELKVCIAGVPGREGSQVGAEVMGPLGVMLMRQSDYATECTTPSNED